ncbi:MAG: AraC-like DNA-binding protein [Myxococcota bacterium]
MTRAKAPRLDALGDALRALRLEGTTYFDADLYGPWGMAIQAGGYANFHLVVQGSCFVQLGDGPAHRMEAGQLVLLPYGDAHTLSHAPGGPTQPAAEMVPTLVETGRFGTGAPATRLVCGHFTLDRAGGHPLLVGLPRALHVADAVATGADVGSGWLALTARLAAAEASGGGLGAAAITDRLAEALMIRVLGRWSETSGVGASFVAAAADPGIGAALQAIHQRPAYGWTLPELAQVAGQSRSAFAKRFKATVGTTARAFLMGWRLLKSRQWMVETDDALDTIADRAGYADVFSFSKAFRRHYGVPPAAWRRARRTG